MSRRAFVRSLEFTVRDSSTGAIIRKLEGEQDAVDSDGLHELGIWYRSLGDRERAHVAEVAYRSADLATYRFLRVLDGADAFMAEVPPGELGLVLGGEGESTVLADGQQGVGLHELMSATTSAIDDGEPIQHQPIPDLPDDRPCRFLPPAGDELRALLLAYFRAKPELWTVFPDPDSSEFWRWVNVDAYAAYADIREHLPPVPPPVMRDIVSAGGLMGFLEAGYQSFAALLRVLEAEGTSFRAAQSLLDFGCGAGRVLRLLQPHAASTDLHGCDIDARAVDWCQKELERVTARVISTSPPLPYAAGAFDLIYSISVFSHLAEENHLLWIEELARICKPGGIVVVTTHGPEALSELAADDEKCVGVGLWPDQVARATPELERDGFAFCRQDLQHHETELYGMTFMTRAYIETHWSAHFEVRAHEPLGLQGWQDVVVLRAK